MLPTMNEQARLDDAIRRADDLLVASLKSDERRRHRRRIFLVSLGGIAMLAIVSALLFAFAGGGDEALKSFPPVVVKTVPESGTDAVDPATTEIRVTFSKDMTDKSWSWSTFSQESFPDVKGDPKYLADKRTCVLPVKLQPGKTYAIWLNSEKFHGFQDADNHSAVPFLLVFRTKR
jgi:hypothetical protein